ncbi:tyrosine-type recombinase/integrase [Rhizobium skierniewicense]|uniref:tyrosine-type recombinase/integrase n=1 Tax=Rhizobium skierniewicense TaxID=984260 RepID=UPI001FAE4258|nr:site-specific integrase [Rhizobium skierniewicense]MCI9865050.1 tyrosine-type recombinase/integrase [Rhizobium skierniewicense]
MNLRSAKTLTLMTLKSIKAGSVRQEMPDGLVPGLYLVIQPSGSKSWALRYRFEGKPKKLTIGPFLFERAEPVERAPEAGAAMTLPEARTAARQALQLLAEGRDPSEARKRAVEAAVTEAVAAKMQDASYLAENLAAEFITKYAMPKNRTWQETQRQFRKSITGWRDPETGEVKFKGPWFGRDVRDISKRDIVKLLDDINDSGSPIAANRIFATLSVWFSWMVGRDKLSVSPMTGLKKNAVESARDRVLSDDEIRILWKAASEEGYPFGQMWQLLLLTGQRRGEVADMEWTELHLHGDEPHWIIPKTRSKNGRPNHVPLTSEAVRILASITRDKGARYVFSTNGATPVSGFSRSKKRLEDRMLEIMQGEAASAGNVREIRSIPQFGLHDLRRTCATNLARLGVPIHIGEAILNHVSGSVSGVAAVYNRFDYIAEKRAALEKWEDFLLRLAGARESNVVSMSPHSAKSRI